MDKTNDMTANLWNDDNTEAFNNETFYHLLMEQYKVYVEMSDRMSARRSLCNVFFLTFHAVILGFLGLSLSRAPYIPSIELLLITLLGLLVLCYAWGRLAQYYRRAVRAKEGVIKELESKLPSSPASQAELNSLVKGRPYNPLRRLELYLPFVFAVLYVFSFFYVAYLSQALH